MGQTFCLDSSKISNELKFILELLKADTDQAVHCINPNLVEMIDWNLFIAQARHHRVYPVLLSKVKVMDEKLIPSFVVDTLSREYKQNTFKMLHMSAEMEQIHQLFEQQSIRMICLKGPILANELYGDLSLRTANDLDILIPIEDLLKAENLLIEAGYQKDDYIQTVLNDWKWRHHHVTYFHPQKRTKVEVHWRLSPGPGKEPSFLELWERKQKSTLFGSSVYLLGKEDLFFFLAAHGARHGWSRLRWLVDMKQLMKMDLDWVTLQQLLKKYYIQHIGGQSIVLATQLLKVHYTREMMVLLRTKRAQKLAQQAIFYMEIMINLHTYPVPGEVSKYHKKHLFSLMSIQQKSLHILSTLHPYPEDVKTLPLPVKFHFLYFPLRPVLWMWRKTRKHALP
ncbi:nucleotidyltransferase domain-containing protein [Jeotgalibacillus marinus]|uniref:Nucleotidyltransferase family protein n=1 Tax=Jeotgalibacillus marinus TaxID=86667 RepID=A0ABV3Q126_9BACL